MTAAESADSQVGGTAAAYDIVAAAYAAALPDTAYEAAEDLELVTAFVGSLVSPTPTVLDAGCGTGRMIGYLTAIRPEIAVTGVDASRGMLSIAREANPSARFAHGDIAAVPAGDATFDGVLAWYSIIHTPPTDLPAVLAEFRRVLRPQGALLLGFQAGDGERRIERPYGEDVALRAFLHRPAEVAAAATAAGFATVESVERPPRPNERHAQGFVIATA